MSKTIKLLKNDKRPSCYTCHKTTAVYNPVFGTEKYCHECELTAIYDYFFPKCSCCEDRVVSDYYDPKIQSYKPPQNLLIDGKHEIFARQPNDPRESKDGNVVCEGCYEDDQQEPKTTITNLNTGETIRVCEYSNYDQDFEEISEGDLGFNVSWQASGGYRGEYVVTSDLNTEIHEDGILAYSDNEQNLKLFDDAVKKLLIDNNITVYQVISRSSNLFYCPYSLWVPNEDLEKFEHLKPKIEQLKKDLRRQEDYDSTCFNGE